MNWDELKEEAKKMGYLYTDATRGTYLFNPENSLCFCRNGCVVAESDMIGGDVYFGHNRTPDQMWQIMEALK
jgi:hypothetical protein